MRDQDPEPDSEEQEPFLLTILPFAGLGLLLVLAVVWRMMPSNTVEPGDDAPTASDEELAEIAITRWERAPQREIPVEPGRDFIIGPDDAPVTLVEFSDFECTYCRTAANGVHDTLEKFGDDVRFVFKNYPLDTACNDSMEQPLHRLACEAAVIARCAGEQDPALFWETHDALFREPQLTADTLHRIPTDLGLDLDRLDTCIGAPPAAEAVQADIALGRSLGVSGTPVFFANGKKLSDYRRGALEAVIGHILTND
jgi:protein-disulfide isomerase